MATPLKGMKVLPLYHEDPIMMGAWLSFFNVSLKQKEVIAAYKKDTGIDITNIFPKSPIDKMIDDACCYCPEDEILKFADWVTENIWGREE